MYVGRDSLWAGRLGDRIPVPAKYYAPVHTGPGAHPYNGYRVSFPGMKRPGRGVDYHPYLAPRLKKEYNYTCTPPLDLQGLF